LFGGPKKWIEIGQAIYESLMCRENYFVVHLNPEMDLASQVPNGFHSFDIILIKLNTFMVNSYKYEHKLASIKEYLAEHTNTIVLDPFESLPLVLRRDVMYQGLSGLISKFACKSFAFPNYTCLSSPCDLQFPVVIKSVDACSKPLSHIMYYVPDQISLESWKSDFSSERLSDFLIQEWKSPEQNRILKLYNIGESWHAYWRPLSDRFSRPESVSTDTYVKLDNTTRPKLADKPYKFAEAMKHTERYPFPVLVQQLKAMSGLTLFGLDFIESDNLLYLIDWNYFPGYKEVPNAPDLISDLIEERLQ